MLLLSRRQGCGRSFRALSSSCQRRYSSSEKERVRIGHVDIKLGSPGSGSSPHLIPSNYLPANPSPMFLQHLQWMMKKDSLSQDMLLIGPNGASSTYRRRLALSFAELTRREVEVLTLSGDITESDLKQRRELIQDGDSNNTSVEFFDQAPVRAAKFGRLLILDGIEKSEKNVNANTLCCCCCCCCCLLL
jgi:hypothetical protein